MCEWTTFSYFQIVHVNYLIKVLHIFNVKSFLFDACGVVVHRDTCIRLTCTNMLYRKPLHGTRTMPTIRY